MHILAIHFKYFPQVINVLRIAFNILHKYDFIIQNPFAQNRNMCFPQYWILSDKVENLISNKITLNKAILNYLNK
jgi:hypothetical protein